MVIVSVGDFFQEQNPPSLPPRAYSLLCRTATPAVLRWVLIGATWLHWRVVVSNLLKNTSRSFFTTCDWYFQKRLSPFDGVKVAPSIMATHCIERPPKHADPESMPVS